MKLKTNRQDFSIFIALSTGFILMELVFRFAAVERASLSSIVISSSFAVISSAIFTLILSLIKNKVAKRLILAAIISVGLIIYGSQIIYNEIFHTYYTFYSMTHGSQVFQFGGDIFLGFLRCWPGILLIVGVAAAMFFVPIKLGFASKQENKVDIGLDYARASVENVVARAAVVGTRLVLLLIVILMTIVISLLVFSEKDKAGSPYEAIFLNNSIDASVSSLGLGMAMTLDAERLFFGFETKQLTEAPVEDIVVSAYEPAVSVDFNSLIENETRQDILEMHQYFASVAPTKENEMTGIFQGKNLIMICAEGYTSYAAHPKYTPTLYKLQNEGYIFENFYNPLWGVSTSDGEYVTCQGLLPKQGVWSMKTSSDNDLPYTMGNQFRKLGYKTLAYHNHYAEYYGRTESHPNMGYTYKGLGTGLKVTEMWPESDLEMIELTTKEYLTPDENGVIPPFHVYYMTVSGHLNYNFSGQAMCRKHKADVADLNLSEACKAYIACHIEFDLAVKKLLSDLETAGVLEDTVIVISGDHYPYGLDNAAISEFLGHPVETTFELYKSNLIIYNAGATQVKTNKYCSSLDIIPTVSNLFGLEYDSRLLMGKDIFSDSWPLVMFKDRSWITNRCFYNAGTGEIIPIAVLDAEDSFTVTPEYIKNINNIVANKFNYSRLILEKNYYHYIQ